MLSSIINKEIFNLYSCVGMFSFEDREFPSEFYLVQYINGKIDIIILGSNTFQFMERFSKEDYYCSISASLVNEAVNVTIIEAVISNCSLNSANGKLTYAILNVYKPVIIQLDEKNLKYDTILVYFTNFLNNLTKNGKFQEFGIVNDDFSIEFKGVHNYEYYKNELYHHREEVVISAVSKITLKNQEMNVVEEMDKLTYLMSYINRTHISPVCFNFYDNKFLVKSILYPALTTRFSNKDKLIESGNVKYFIEKCYPIFSENYHDFALNIIISIYLESLLSNYVDSSYVLLISALESFLLAHENQCKKNGENINPSSFKRVKKTMVDFFKEHGYEINEEDLELLSKKVAYGNTTVLDKFSLLKKEDKFKPNLNLKPEDYDFPKIRNEIIHTGKVPNEINSSKGKRKINMSVEYNRVLFLVDKIILSLLEYDGVFNDYLNKKEISF